VCVLTAGLKSRLAQHDEVGSLDLLSMVHSRLRRLRSRTWRRGCVSARFGKRLLNVCQGSWGTEVQFSSCTLAPNFVDNLGKQPIPGNHPLGRLLHKAHDRCLQTSGLLELTRGQT